MREEVTGKKNDKNPQFFFKYTVQGKTEILAKTLRKIEKSHGRNN